MSETPKEHISICVVGHVDAGKSSTCGRLMFELGGINEREMAKLKESADQLGKSSFMYAFYMDKTAEERTRGITISCTTKEFFTSQYHYSLIDSPGHVDFIKNMISGSSQCDSCLLLVPADGGFTTSIARKNREENTVEGQSRQHAKIINLLGVKQLVVGINKMDTCAYSEERFNEIANEVKDMLIKVGWPKIFVNDSVPIIPYSGWCGDNLLKRSEAMPWWKGTDVKALDGTMAHVETIYEALDTFIKVPKRLIDKPLRAPISGIYSIKGVGTVLTTRIETGTVKPGAEVVFLPAHSETNPCTGKIFTIEMHHRSIPMASSGDNVGMNIKGLNKDYLPSVGNVMILKTDNTLKAAKRFTAMVNVMDHPGELHVGYSPIVFCRTERSSCKMIEIKWKISKETGGQKVENPPFIKQNEAAEVVFEPQQGFVVEPYNTCEGLGRLAVFDGGSLVMIAKVTNVEF